MKALLLSLLLFTATSFTLNTYESSYALDEAQSTVLICTGKYSKRYHKVENPECRGLKSCTGELKKVPVMDAKKKGLTACGFCYR